MPRAIDPVHRRATHDRRRRAAEGAVDAANMLKRCSPRELRAVGGRRSTIPQYIEKTRARAALPADLRRRAVGPPTRSRSCRPQGHVRVASRRPHPRRGARRAAVCRTATSPTVLPDKAIDSSTRRGRTADGDRLVAGRARRSRAAWRSSRSSSLQWQRIESVREPVERELADAQEVRNALAARWGEEKQAPSASRRSRARSRS